MIYKALVIIGKEISAFCKMIHKGVPYEKLNPPIPKWGIKEKIAELKDDNGLDPEYIESLIKQSNSREYIMEIRKYLTDPDKVYNLSATQLLQLNKLVKSQIKNIEDAEVLRSLIQLAKEVGKESILP